MNIYDETNIVERFEEKFGQREAIRRGCDLMVSYLTETTSVRPDVASRGLSVAQRFKNGMANVSEIERAEKDIWNYLKENLATTDYSKASCNMAHAVKALLYFYRNPYWGGGASEVVSNFLELFDISEIDEYLLKNLLKSYFADQ